LPAVNFRISVNGRCNWCAVDGLAAEITAGCRTDEEQETRLRGLRRGSDSLHSGITGRPCRAVLDDEMLKDGLQATCEMEIAYTVSADAEAGDKLLPAQGG
jgi:hypothetical protein